MSNIALITLLVIALLVVRDQWQQYRIRMLPRLSNDDLLALFEKQSNRVLYLQAARELKRRSIDTTFALPHFIDMCLSINPALRILGWSGLRQLFIDQVPGVDLSSSHPSREAIQRLAKFRESLREK